MNFDELSEIQGYHIQGQWRHRQDNVSGDGNRHWKPPTPPSHQGPTLYHLNTTSGFREK